MRKAAAIEQWQELYEAAIELFGLEPWRYVWDVDLIGIKGPSAKNLAFCSIMGRSGESYGINVYEGISGLNDFDMIARSEELGLTVSYVMGDQDCLTCYLGDLNEVPNDQRRIIKELGLRFRGKGKWIFFQSYKKRYSPVTPDAREVQVLIAAYRQLICAIKDIKEQKIWVDSDENRHLWRIYNKKTKVWTSQVKPMPECGKTYTAIRLQDDLLRMRLKKRPEVPAEIMIDFIYLHGRIKDKHYERPVNPLVMVALDMETHQIIAMTTLAPDEKEIDMLLHLFIQFVEQYGRMQAIYFRNMWVPSALTDICDYCNIDLYMDRLEEMDDFEEELRKNFFS